MSFGRVSSSVLKTVSIVHKRFTTRCFSRASCQAMRFVQYKDSNGRGLGIQCDEQVISLSSADKTIPVDMVSYLSGEHSVEQVEK